MTRLLLINCDPENAEDEVPVGSTVAFDLVDTLLGGGVDVNATIVEIRVTPTGPWMLAFDSGAFQPPFFGSQASPYTGAERWQIAAPPGTWESLEQVFVRVKSRTLDLVATLDETYSFTIEDLTYPLIDLLLAEDLLHLRVTFDEAVKMVDPSLPNDALNPANYILVALSAPAVPLIVESVERVDDQTVLLQMNWEMTAEAQYELTVSDVEDLFGNEVGGP